jgi:hypothetical protein
MKVNLNHCFVDAFGKQIEKSNIAEKLGMVLFNLSTVNGAPLGGAKKYEAYSLCHRIASNPEAVELTVEEAALLKDVCAEQLSAGAYGQIVDLIEKND